MWSISHRYYAHNALFGQLISNVEVHAINNYSIQIRINQNPKITYKQKRKEYSQINAWVSVVVYQIV